MRRPKSYTDGKRSWLGSSLRQAWPHDKPHIYKAKKGWVVRAMSFGRVRVWGPFYFLPTALKVAREVWNNTQCYINARARRNKASATPA